MGLLDLFRSKEITNIETKDPGFVTTGYNKNTVFQSLINDTDDENFFDQLVLYTYKCIDLISNSVASQEFSVVRIGDENGGEIDTEGIRTLKHFNNYMSLYDAIKLVVTHLKATGAAYWVIREPENTKHKYDIFPLNPVHVTIKTNNFGLPAYYQYEDGSGEIVKFETDEIVYFRNQDPENWFEGRSDIKAFRDILNTYKIGTQFNMNKLNSDGMPDFFLWFDNLTSDQRDRTEQQLRSKYMGKKNARRQGVLSGKVKPEVINLSANQKDLDFVEGMKMMRQDILALFGVPEALLFPSATNSNTKEALKMFQQQTIKPILQHIKSVLNEQFLTRVESERTVDTIEFIYEDPVDQDRLEQSQIVKNYTDAGFTLNQALELTGLDPIEGGDVRASEPVTTPNPFDEKTVDAIRTKIIDDVTNTLSTFEGSLVQESKKEEKERWKVKQLEKSSVQEDQILQVASDTFIQQFKYIIDSIGDKSVSIRSLPSLEELDAIVIANYKGAYQRVMSESNGDANIEIKKALKDANFKSFMDYKSKGISPEALVELDAHLQIFAKELDTVTLDKLKVVVSEGIKDDLDNNAMKDEIANVFNGYLDGVKNVEELKKFDAYIDAVSVTVENGVVQGSSNRYNKMLEIITQGDFTDEQRTTLLRALKGVVDTSDEIGASVNNLLSTIYGIKDDNKISTKRAETIARTESTYARNLGLDGTYTNNPFVKGVEWNALNDNDTRDAHGALYGVDGEQTEIGVPFIVGGEKMRFPGDSSLGASASNIVNCRCRITAVV